MSTTAIPSNLTTQFWKMVKKTIDAETMENLDYLTKLPSRRLRFLQNPNHGVGTMNPEEIETFANILKLGVDDLILKYGCGSACLTIDDLKKVVHPMGYEVGMIAHAA